MSTFRLPLLVLLPALALTLVAGESKPAFSESLTPEQRARLGLAHLTPAQVAELDAAVSAYAQREHERTSAETLKQVERKAAEAAVAEYRRKQEPGVIGKALSAFKQRQEEEQIERFTARVSGEFRGWRGGTYFPLENGQVWRQVNADVYELPPVAGATVEIYRSKNGYWRLVYDGAWITVKRLQ